MLNDNAKLWVEALRSGKYRQGKSSLRDGDKFCCLGVACDISELGKWGPASESPTARAYIAAGNTYGSESYLPAAVMDWLGLTTNCGEHSCPDYPRTIPLTLAALNDNGKTFEEIAALIESEPEGLFRKENDDERTG